ncbi:HAD ATPase, P-type, family IC [Protomyces lactucae-debilis]|uniref:Cation-transporting ATPase n=1 Tax=Protomyces lactucae-debilis TaxID=2754530 RepID=A0A1Y2ES50_PROLT|nr:HAD ATPase, P-type, family IC [Protomyces lactucae-debilis]ORY74114.1 HAD ATPase, P-type, family IC [Protomyces lactucae-debilis]
MASESIFDGPISESVPTAQTGFAHRVSFSQDRNGSDASAGLLSLQFFRSEYDEERDDESMIQLEEDAIADDESIADTESIASSRRSSMSRVSLLRRQSQESNASGERFARKSQKVYLQEEDLYLVIAGFKDARLQTWLYYLLCIVTFGIAYLVLRWVPRWKIRMTGKPVSLSAASWVVIENQWHDVSIHTVQKAPFGGHLSSILDVGRSSEDENDPWLDHICFLDYRYVRFLWNPRGSRFELYNNYKDPAWRETIKVCARGLEDEATTRRLTLFGENLIDIAEKSTAELLVDEALHPFYVFQIASIILWSCDEYYYYAICIFVISISSIAATVLETKRTMRRLRELARFSCDVRVLRNSYWQLIQSSMLVPGDVFEISDPSIDLLPCDALLLSGECVVNESMLTGESVPVAKVAANDKGLHRLANASTTISSELGRHYLFSGTKLIQVKKPQTQSDEEENAALAMVTRTGFNTTKGSLVRSMLFPKPAGFKFYRDSFRFIGFMAIIAICGFVLSAINFIRLGLPWSLILIRALDLITIVVPPALPATLTIGTSFAVERLKKHNIFCISPSRVNVAGKIDVMCFDKTGTLTEDGLDILGVRPIEQADFCGLLEKVEELVVAQDQGLTLLNVMATCHSLRLINGELLGDPLDDKMFRFTGWTYEEGGQNATLTTPSKGLDHKTMAAKTSNKISPPIVRSKSGSPGQVELGIMRQFEFVSNLRRMSVIAKRFQSNDMEVYLKGAPEVMKDVCKSDSLPDNYEEILASYTHRGYRVIGCAGKVLPGFSWIKAQKIKRQEAEKDLTFLGFIIFENKLKPSTTASIRDLNEANIRNVMCTGDNILTAISVARECQMLQDMTHVFVPRFTESGGATNALQTIVWENMENPNLILDSRTLLPVSPAEAFDNPFAKQPVADFRLAVTGEIFRWTVDFASQETLERLLIKGTVFARMSPDEKQELVEKLQSIDYCVGFCGDGANDCGALKAADVGVSLSEAEASVAAPFTSRSFEISCIIRVIRDGRAALVTSFSCFKYMALYSAIQFTTVSILYRTASNLGDFQFLMIDLALILPIAVFMGRAEPHKVLARKRPTANLVSKKILGSLIGQIVIIVSFQVLIWALVKEQPFYRPPRLRSDSPSIVSSDNTVLFLLSLYQYILVALVLSVGPPYREPMYRNWSFILTIILTLALTTFITVSPTHWFHKVLQLTKMSTQFSLFLIGLALVHYLLASLGETYVFARAVQVLSRMTNRLSKSAGKKRKTWKIVSEQMAGEYAA